MGGEQRKSPVLADVQGAGLVAKPSVAVPGLTASTSDSVDLGAFSAVDGERVVGVDLDGNGLVALDRQPARPELRRPARERCHLHAQNTDQAGPTPTSTNERAQPRIGVDMPALSPGPMNRRPCRRQLRPHTHIKQTRSHCGCEPAACVH